MLQLITSGNTYKNLIKIYKLNSTKRYHKYLNFNKLQYEAQLCIPVWSQYKGSWDSLNKVNSGNSVRVYKRKTTYLYNYIKNSYMYIWTRVIFRGKGFRIRNFKDDFKLTLNFGHSHWTRILFYKNWLFWKLKRQSYVLITTNISLYIYFSYILPNVKKLNKYTKRGLRLKRQEIVRRFGKISQVVSLLH